MKSINLLYATCHASYNHRIEIVTTAPETQCKAKEIGGVILHTEHYNLISALTFIHNSQIEISDPDSLQVPEKQSRPANLLGRRSLHTDWIRYELQLGFKHLLYLAN